MTTLLLVLLCAAFAARYRRGLLRIFAQARLLRRGMRKEFHQQQDW